MEPRSTRKIFVLILAVCVAFSVVFTTVLTAAEHDHDCRGEDCPICLRIEAAEYFLKTLKLAGIGLFLAVCSVFSVKIHTKYTDFTPCFLSPVTLKVRINF